MGERNLEASNGHPFLACFCTRVCRSLVVKFRAVPQSSQNRMSKFWDFEGFGDFEVLYLEVPNIALIKRVATTFLTEFKCNSRDELA